MTIFLIAGPTASGKSSLAHHLSQQIDGEIINADSMQIYKGLPILSAQPPEVLLQDVPHHLYAYLSPAKQEDVVSWCQKAQKCIRDITEKQKKVILVGGTGLYFKTLLEGISPVPPIPRNIRDHVQHQFDTGGLDLIYGELKKLDPKTSVNAQNPMRIMRALEVILHTGDALSVFQKMAQTSFLSSPHKTIYLKPPRSILHDRIKLRMDDMFKDGAIEEVERLGDIASNAGIYKTIGYTEIREYLEEKISFAKMKELIHIRTRQYAKRQETWFNNQFKSDFILESTNTEENIKRILSCPR